MLRGKGSGISALSLAGNTLGANLELKCSGFYVLKPTLVRDCAHKGNVLLYESE